MYEGIGLISEKHAVVLDIGHAFTKCGYAGEISPRCVIRSEIESGKLLHEINNKSYLYNALVEFIHRLYFKCLLVNPKDRRVVIIESVIGSSLFKETLARVLFRHYEVSSVLFAPSHLLPLFTLGIRTALVLDVGHSEATLIPIYEGVPILKSWQAQPLAGAALQESLRIHLLERGQLLRGGANNGDQALPTPLAQQPQILTPHLLEDITVRCCLITSLNRGRELDKINQDASQVTSLTTVLKNSAPTIRYSVGGNNYLEVDGIAREGAAEVLFQMDSDGNCIGSMVLNALQSCPIDTRRDLASSILIVGGTSMMPGFKSRLNQELLYLLSLPQYADIKITEFKVYEPPAKPNLVTWLGGAIFGATDVVVTRSLTREQYLKDPSVPDWSDLRYNYSSEDPRQG